MVISFVSSGVGRGVVMGAEDHVANDVRDQSDAALVMGIARYRQDALAEVYRRHGGAVFALASRVVGDAGNAEEIVQEVLLKLWSSPDRFDPERGSLRSFLLTQTHSRAVDLLRRDGSRRRREESDAHRTAEAGYDLEHEVWDLAVAEQVRDAMGALPANERKPIELAYFGGHSYREVAVMLDEPEGTVKSRIRSGLRRLRSELQVVGILGAEA
jgi:RNA polymerase sigma-70 factor (ECF subfamily)